MKIWRIIVGLITFVSMPLSADDPTSMVMPTDNGCGEFYILIEDVCVHALAIMPSKTLKSDIEKFKKTGVAPVRKTKVQNTAGLTREQVRCNKFKERLKEYETEGVLGVHALTGKIVKMEGKAAEKAIQFARDNVEIFCEGL